MTLQDPRLPGDPELSPAKRALLEARLWGCTGRRRWRAVTRGRTRR